MFESILNTIKAEPKKLGKIKIFFFLKIMKIHNSCNLQEFFPKKNYSQSNHILINS
jgi:hypothetical protein